MKDCGYLIVAQNTSKTDYLRCARVLAQSIRNTMPDASVSLLTDTAHTDSLYDNVIMFPHGDRCANSDWKLANDWQVYEATPYEHTIKLEADMYLPANIDHWWDALLQREMHVCTTIRNITGEISSVRVYRPTIDNNLLPDTYNAITYFRRGTLASEFYTIVRHVFENWNTWQNEIITQKDELATTDIAYAIAARTIGEQHCTNPEWTHISMTHMKQYVNGGAFENWTHEYVYEILPEVMRINTYAQLYPLHYHIKQFAEVIQEEQNGW